MDRYQAAGFLDSLYRETPVPPSSPAGVLVIPGPCPVCGCAIYYRLAGGRIVCGNCRPTTPDEVEQKLVLVNDPEENFFTGYDKQRTAQEAHRETESKGCKP